MPDNTAFPVANGLQISPANPMVRQVIPWLPCSPIPLLCRNKTWCSECRFYARWLHDTDDRQPAFNLSMVIMPVSLSSSCLFKYDKWRIRSNSIPLHSIPFISVSSAISGDASTLPSCFPCHEATENQRKLSSLAPVPITIMTMKYAYVYPNYIRVIWRV